MSGQKQIIDRILPEVVTSYFATYSSLGHSQQISVQPDKIVIAFPDGGGITVGADGHITLDSKSSKGMTIGSSAGPLILKGTSVKIEGSGDTSISSGNFSLTSSGDISLKGTKDGAVEISGGNYTSDFISMINEIKGDYSLNAIGKVVTGGGELQFQSDSTITLDSVKEIKGRTNGFVEMHAGQYMHLFSNEPMKLNSKSQMELNSEGLLALYSHGGSIIGRAGQSIGLNAHGTFYAISTLAQISSKGEMSIRANGLLSINSDGSDIKIASNANVLISGSSKTQIYGGEVDIDANGEIHMQMRHASKVYPLSAIDVPDQKQSDKNGEGIQAPTAATAYTPETRAAANSSKPKQPDGPETGPSGDNESGQQDSPDGGASTGGGSPSSGSGNPGSGSPNPLYTPSAYQRPSNPGPSGGAGKLYSGPEDSWNGVDQRLKDIYDCGTPKFEQATGYKVTMFSGRRPRPNNPNSYHPLGQAFDVYITDGCGKKLDNYQGYGDNNSFAAYEVYAQYLRECQLQLYPNMPFRWGGYFTGGRKNPFYGYGALDSMHFDNGSNSMGAGSWNDGLHAPFAEKWNINSSKGGGVPDPSRLPKGCQEASNQSGDDTWLYARSGTEIAKKAEEQGEPQVFKITDTA